MTTIRTLAGAALMAVSIAASSATPRYTVTDLGTLSAWGALSEGVDINNAGQVLGLAKLPNGTRLSFIWDAGTLTGVPGIRGYGLNDAGRVAGITASTGRPALYSNNVIMDVTPTGGTRGVAFAINSQGQVAGLWSSGSAASRGFLYSPGAGSADIGNFGAPGNDTVAYGINDAGQVVGYSTTLMGDTHAFLYAGGQMTDLGTLPGGDRSLARSISENGIIVGSASIDSLHEHAFLLSDGVMHDLGVLNGPPELGAGDSSEALDVNNAGMAVGHSWYDRGSRHAFLYMDGQLHDLNDLIDPASGWTLVSATGINDRGDISAYGCDVNGACFGLLLTAQAVPEPAGWALMLAGLGLVAARRSARAARRR